MAKEVAQQAAKVKVPAEQWIGRLSVVLKAFDEMEDDERSAALAFLRSKYRNQWPSDPY